MEVKAIVRAINEKDLNLETEAQATIVIPKLMLPDAKLDQVVYISCNLESNQAARETLNELLSSHD